jgi:hypothetical protein
MLVIERVLVVKYEVQLLLDEGTKHPCGSAATQTHNRTIFSCHHDAVMQAEQRLEPWVLIMTYT